MGLPAEITHHWSGSIPGYGDATDQVAVISAPERQVLVAYPGGDTALPEVANWVTLSDQGQVAWQGHETGAIYEGLTRRGLGFGQHSFVYVGETLRWFEDAATYQATAGGWRYVVDGAIVPFGVGYSGPPLWNHEDFGSVSIGQGPDEAAGLCVKFTNESAIRQIAAGNWNDIRVRHYADRDLFVITAVEYSAHVTCVWRVTSAQLLTCVTINQSAGNTPPPPQPVVPPSPIPQGPPMPTAPNELAVVRQVIAAHPEIDRMADGVRGAITVLVVQALGGMPWGLKDKDNIPNGGQPVSDDALCYLLPDGRFEIYDILSGGDGSAQWDYKGTFRDGENGWFRVVTGVTPGGPPAPPSAGTVGQGLDSELKRLQALVDGLASRLAAVEARPVGQPSAAPSIDGVRIALIAEANGRVVCADNGGASPLVANRDGAGSWETFKIQVVG